MAPSRMLVERLMGAIYIERAEDLPYGPENPDYEYDRFRIERDAAENRAFCREQRLDPMTAWPFPGATKTKEEQ